MRKLIIALSTCVLFGASAVYAAEAQPMDESTNPNTNTDMKTQNLQQKPNSDEETQRKANRHSKAHKKATDNVANQPNDSTSSYSDSNTEKLRQKPE